MIYNEENFNKNLPAGYDGKFDWDIFKESGCFGDTRIEPMDFDGVVERNKHYLVFETKDQGKELPKGQEITLSNLNEAKSFTVVLLWPKAPPFDTMEIRYHSGPVVTVKGHDDIVKKIAAWFSWADGRSAAPEVTTTKKARCSQCGRWVDGDVAVCDLCTEANKVWTNR